MPAHKQLPPPRSEQAEAAEKTAGAAAAPRAEASGTADSAPGRYCTALVNLYGVICSPPPWWLQLYNQFHRFFLSPPKTWKPPLPALMVNGELIHKKSWPTGTMRLPRCAKKQAHYNHYLPSANHIDDYLDERYRENTREFIAIARFLLCVAFHMKEALATANALQYLAVSGHLKPM